MFIFLRKICGSKIRMIDWYYSSSCFITLDAWFLCSYIFKEQKDKNYFHFKLEYLYFYTIQCMPLNLKLFIIEKEGEFFS